MNASLSAEFLILCKYLGIEADHLIKGALNEVLGRQNEDGGFSAYSGGASDMSLSWICKLGIELHQTENTARSLQRCNNFLISGDGLDKAMLLPRFYHFLFEKYPVRKLPEIRPGLNILPKWTGISIYNMASWVRSWIVPISILWHQEKYRNYKYSIRFYFPPLRRYSLKKAEKWMLDHQEKDGSWYGVFHSTMMSMMALHSLGYKIDHPVIKKAFDFVLSLQDHKEDRIRQQAFLGPVWDSALAMIALNTPVNEEESSIIKRAARFLLKQQVLKEGDWSQNSKSNPGAWSFEYCNEHYPDVDTTSVVLRALKPFNKDKAYQETINRGLKWLLSMQNSDGSWSAFDRNNNHGIIEFYLKLRKYNIGKGPGLVLDRGTPDLSAHALETLAAYGFDRSALEVRKAIVWLKKNQCTDGSWFGRWGLCYIYGTSAVLEALAAIGVSSKEDWIRNAVNFLKSRQNPDGGFGEVPESYYDPSKKGIGPSTLTQTSWALLGLINSGEGKSKAVKKGIAFIKKRLREIDPQKERYFQAVAAPPLFQRYELYPLYFPLMALKICES